MALTKLPKNALGTGSVDASKIEDGTIQTAELSGTVTADKLNATLNLSSKTVTLPNTSVTSDMLANTTVANAKLSNSSITVRGTARNLGDTFTIGVDVDWQSVQTGDFTAAAGKGYFVNTTSAAVEVTLPASASIGDTIAIKDYAGTFATNNLTIARNSHNIQGVANNSLISTNRASLVLVYVDATKGWLFTDEHNVGDLRKPEFTQATGGTVATSGNFKIHSFTGDGCFVVSVAGNAPVSGGGPANVDYLVIAGGGGGGYGVGGSPNPQGGSGGGAGGYRTTFPSPGCNAGAFPISSQTYPITVGAGGAGGPRGPIGPVNNPGENGSNSIFSTITSAGGGGGGEAGGGPGSDGGSGGGHPYTNTNSRGAGNTPPVSPPQGNPGGIATGAPPKSGQGGGGAGGAAPDGPKAGGNGSANSITESSVTRAGGGGGGGGCGSTPGGSGGPGGGGAGGASLCGVGSNGTVNTGGGAGGGGGGTTVAGGAGGSGIVIIRYKFQ